MRFSCEDHFQHEVSKRLTKAGVEHRREWVHWVEFSTQRRVEMRADIFATRGISAEKCVQAWVEIKTTLGMHELATAIGQVRLARQLYRKGGARPSVAQTEYLVIPSEMYSANPEMVHMITEEGITCAHEDSLPVLIKADFEWHTLQHKKAAEALRGAVSKLRIAA